MSKVITFSRVFPKGHPKSGAPTYFVEKIMKSLYNKTPLMLDHFEKLNPDYDKIADFRGSLRHPMDFTDMPKYTTIRSGHRFKAGEYFSPRVWSDKPYQSKQIIIAPDILIEKTFYIKMYFDLNTNNQPEIDVYIDNQFVFELGSKLSEKLAINDGLLIEDFIDWFKIHKKRKKQVFRGQIICWNKSIEYVSNNKKNNISENEGWSLDITTRNKTHYYKNGISLCEKATAKKYMKNFDKRAGSKYFKDCCLCVKKLNKV